MKFLHFFDSFIKNTPTSNFMKIPPLWAKMFHADRRTDGLTDLTNLMVAFRNYVKAPNKIGNFYVSCSVFK